MPEPTEKPVRYFFISYNGCDPVDKHSVIGHLAFSSLGYPSLLWLTEQLVPNQSKINGNDIENVVIGNFYEFKSKEDFDDFCLGWDAMDNINNFLQN